MAQPDFRAQPIPGELLQGMIQAQSRSPLATAVQGVTSGVEKGLELTEKITAIKEKKQMAREVAAMVTNPEFKELNDSTMGLAKLAVMKDPVETLNIFSKIKENKVKPDLQPAYNELKAIEDTANKFGWNDELKSRYTELGQMMKTGQYAYNWTKNLGEPLSVKMKRETIKSARQLDPQYDNLYKQTQTALQAWKESNSAVDEKNYQAAKETFVGYHNTKYPQNTIPSFEEADTFFLGIPVGKKIVPKNLSPEDQKAWDWANKKENADNPEADKIKKHLGG